MLALEKLSRGGSRFHDSTLRSRGVVRVPLRGPRATLALLGCAVPLAGGFLLPAGVMLKMALSEGDAQFGTRFFTLAGNSILVAGTTALLATALALLIAYAARVDRSAPTRWAHRVAGLGYALPGSVIAVGVLIPVTKLDHALAALLRQGFGIEAGLLLTGTIAALVYACVVRYLTAAL